MVWRERVRVGRRGRVRRAPDRVWARAGIHFGATLYSADDSMHLASTPLIPSVCQHASFHLAGPSGGQLAGRTDRRTDGHLES